MDAMIAIGGERGFQEGFNRTVAKLFRFLGIEESTNPRRVLELCMEVNKKASTTQGVKNAPALITIQKVKGGCTCGHSSWILYTFFIQIGVDIVPQDVLAMPHCFIFLEGDDVHGMLLVLKTGIAYIVPDVRTVWEALCLLISTYYVFDLQYFAAFGLLAVLDKYIFHVGDELVPPPSKKSKKKRMSSNLDTFMERFDKFITEELAHLLGINDPAESE